MTTKRIYAETIEELVDLLMEMRVDSSDRFRLQSDSTLVWTDPVAGAEWEAIEKAMCDKYPRHWSLMPENKDDHDNYEKEMLAFPKPDMRRVSVYSLRRSPSGSPILLGHDLGVLIESVWTKKQPYRNAQYKVPIGALSLPGLLKRLGQTEISAQLLAAQKAKQAQLDKQARNARRRQVVR